VPEYDALVLGAGHNGLAAAAYLARAGLRTAVLERREVIGGATAEEVLTLRGRRVRAAMARPGLLGDAGIRELQIGDCHDSSAAPLLASISEALRKMYPMELASWGVSKRDRLRAGADHPVRVAADRVGNILGFTEFDVYVHDLTSEKDVRVELSSPPSIMVPSWAHDLSQSQLVFLIARPITNVARDLHALDKLDDDDLRTLLLAAARSVAPGFGTGYAPEDELDYRSQQLMKALSWRARTPAQEAASHFAANPPADVVAWAHAIKQTAARAAMLLSDDVSGSVDITRRVRGLSPDELDPASTDLVRFWVSDTAARFRRATQ